MNVMAGWAIVYLSEYFDTMNTLKAWINCTSCIC